MTAPDQQTEYPKPSESLSRPHSASPQATAVLVGSVMDGRELCMGGACPSCVWRLPIILFVTFIPIFTHHSDHFFSLLYVLSCVDRYSVSIYKHVLGLSLLPVGKDGFCTALVPSRSYKAISLQLRWDAPKTRRRGTQPRGQSTPTL